MFAVTCPCGREIQVRPDALGRRVRCVGCGGSVMLVLKEGAAQPAVHFTPAPEPAARPRPISTRTTGDDLFADDTDDPLWNRRYWFLLAFLIPLFFSFFHEVDVNKQLERTLEKESPAVRDRALAVINDGGRLEDVADVLPSQRLAGAFLSRGSSAHWFFAALSAAGFAGVLLALFPRGTGTSRQILLTGLFTGTIGVLLLFGIQYMAFTGNVPHGGGGGGVALIVIVQLIALSYYAAESAHGFVVSFFGFTCGAGLLEELVKTLPVIVLLVRGRPMPWRAAVILGMASGIGFGVSEGITYSSGEYNGVERGDAYIVRFVSCVALHGFWAAAAAIALAERRAAFGVAPRDPVAIVRAIARAIAVPMVLHGLYDTLLKQDHGILAFVTAAASFAWLAWRIERARAGDAPAAAARPA